MSAPLPGHSERLMYGSEAAAAIGPESQNSDDIP